MNGKKDGKKAAVSEMLEEALRILARRGDGSMRIYAARASLGAASAIGAGWPYAQAWAEAFVTEVLRVRDERAAHEDTRQ